MEFKINESKTSTPELLQQQGTIIFNKIFELGSGDAAFKDESTNYEYTHIKKVEKETDRLFKLIEKLVLGKYVTQHEVAHYDEETGEKVIDTPKEYYKPTTKSNLKGMFASDYINDTDALEVFVTWKGFDYDSEFDKFLESYNNK